MTDTDGPGDAAQDEDAGPAEATTTVGPNLPLQVQHNAEDSGTATSPSEEDDDDKG